MNPPQKVPPNHPFARWWNPAVDFMLSLRPMNAPGVLTTHTPHGVIRRGTGKGVIQSIPAAGNADIRLFRITTIGGVSLWDYFKGKEITAPSGTLAGSETIIAKQMEYRPSLSSEHWDAVITDYTWTDDNNRTSVISGSDPEVSQTEILWPRYSVSPANRDVVACKVPYTGVVVSDVPVVWLDITTRVWQRIYGQ